MGRDAVDLAGRYPQVSAGRGQRLGREIAEGVLPPLGARGKSQAALARNWPRIDWNWPAAWLMRAS